MIWMKKNAYEESTIKKTAKILRHLQRNCTLKDPENVKGYIANKKCSKPNLLTKKQSLNNHNKEKLRNYTAEKLE
jgi:hypothetical protein